ncbi:MAG: phage tail tip lysozyme, partial [Staphylococcus equorum]|nr:phage tail tip lysozyme [Staphylococcus equorum]
WSNGKEKGKDKGKGGFQDSLIGKPVTKAWNGITSFFGGGDSKGGGGGGGGSSEPTLNQKAGTGKSNTEGNKDIKDSENKKKKMTAEELRQKNNKSETENLKTFKNLLNRWEQSIQEAKGLDIDSDGGSDIGGSASDVGGSGKKKIFSFLKQKGLTDNQVSAVMGNLDQESNLDPEAVNPSSGAFGIAQWLGNRKTGLDNYAKSEGKKNTDLDTQLDYLWKEMESGYDSDMLHKAGWSKDASLEKNTKAFATGFERMGANEAMMDTRVGNAKSFKKQFAGGGGGRDWGNQEQPAYTNRSFATMQRQQMASAQVPTNNTANVSVNITVNGSDNPERTAQSVRDNLNSYFNSEDLSIFQNNYRRT